MSLILNMEPRHISIQIIDLKKLESSIEIEKSLRLGPIMIHKCRYEGLYGFEMEEGIAVESLKYGFSFEITKEMDSINNFTPTYELYEVEEVEMKGFVIPKSSFRRIRNLEDFFATLVHEADFEIPKDVAVQYGKKAAEFVKKELGLP